MYTFEPKIQADRHWTEVDSFLGLKRDRYKAYNFKDIDL